MSLYSRQSRFVISLFFSFLSFYFLFVPPLAFLFLFFSFLFLLCFPFLFLCFSLGGVSFHFPLVSRSIPDIFASVGLFQTAIARLSRLSKSHFNSGYCPSNRNSLCRRAHITGRWFSPGGCYQGFGVRFRRQVDGAFVGGCYLGLNLSRYQVDVPFAVDFSWV